MSYDELLEQRIRRYFDAKRIKYEAKRMMGELCFMVKGKMCVGIEKKRLMARIGPGAYEAARAQRLSPDGFHRSAHARIRFRGA
jgi:hypothetical protein